MAKGFGDQKISPQAYIKFLDKVLQATKESKGNKKVVYPLLQANLDKLDDNFAKELRRRVKVRRAEVRLSQESDIAAVIGNFSNLIVEFPRGSRANNIEIAIVCCQNALEIYTREAFPDSWAMAQMNLGNAYRDRIRGEKAQNLEDAITCFRHALEIYTRDAFPDHWAMTKMNFGAAYSDRIRGEKAQNLEDAIACYQNALEIYTRSAFRNDWAMTQMNLGAAYRNRIRGEKAQNLEDAITCFREALKVYTRSAFPNYWAKTQVNLGNAYGDRIRGEKAQNLEDAIACFQNALEIYTRKAFPDDWAMTKMNLGNAYGDRIRGEKAQNLEDAITCFRNALEVYTRDAFPDDWAKTKMNLGVAYRNRIGGEKAQNLEDAITCFRNALEVYTRDTFPDDWAKTKINLGNAYHNRIGGEKAQNLEAAITCFRNALEIYTRDTFPDHWARVQINLGNAYNKRIEGEKAQNIEDAIACYGNALEVHTRDAFPDHWAKAQKNLGITYQDEQQFDNAYTAFKTAIDTVELLRDEIISGSGIEEDKEKLAEEWNKLYQRMVEVCLELGEINQAIEYVERSKTRNLVELILTRDFHNIFPTETATQLQQLQKQIAINQKRLQTGAADDRTNLVQRLSEQRKQHNDLQDKYLPIGSSFQFQQFQATLDEHTAIIEFYLTNEQILTFIITRHSQQPIILKSDSENLRKLERFKNGYFRAYDNPKFHWQRRLNTRLKLLAKILRIDEIIKQIPKQCHQLVLIPHRYLHLFPLQALPVTTQAGDKSQCLLDYFPQGVRYAPSCQLLQLVQNRERPNFTKLFAIQNPTNDLTYTDIEVETIQNYFNPKVVLKKQQATKAEINQTSLNNFDCLHFSCHGQFNFDNPRKSALVLAGARLQGTKPSSERYISLRDGELYDLDKCLTLETIFTLNLKQCRLVTLSACETGLIKPNSISDEYIGLPSGFLVAGSSSVVASLWRVRDLSTAFLMIKFYQNLNSGMSVAVALNQAQIWMRNTTQEELLKWTKDLPVDAESKDPFQEELDWYNPEEKPFQDPKHWAAFCAIGQ
ncbi:MAG: CHAT domain-containing protein [Symploca sp. SIO1C4]|uniref:CHAT domain-containing protein n=1 Tax=Symploca sp. SIO1C4 TaxID=2607765 RepID=A0A6B3N085_9CYAN|nr:CHAT domain-containing protein [Symploca sp. SIO1C4]